MMPFVLVGATICTPAPKLAATLAEETLNRARPDKELHMPEDDSDTPVLDTLAEMTAASIENSDLEAREHMLVRLAALVAVGAPPTSYLLNAGTAADVGVTLDDVEGVLVAVAPIVGTARVITAGGNITRPSGSPSPWPKPNSRRS